MYPSILAQSALQILGNPKTSLVRKRQMMQQLFGDYRQKMQEEEAAAGARTCLFRVHAESLL
jgi:hypothetical protein